MFYLIDSLSYWDEYGNIVDFLQVNNFSFSDSEIETYHRIASQESETDEYRLLDESDIETSLDKVEENYNNAIEHCFVLKNKLSHDVLKNQIKQYNFARKALGESAKEWSTAYDDKGSVWEQRFYRDLSEIAEEYNRRAQGKISNPDNPDNYITLDLLKKTNNIYDNLFKVVELSLIHI